MLKTSYQTELLEAGIDEAGRGCYAGPVFAAAVILPADFYHPLLNDSKQVKEKDRYELRAFIQENAIAWAVASVEEAEIDRINILQATWKAMHSSIQSLHTKPELLLIDGNRFRSFSGIPHRCIIKGDALYASIAAASILAKTCRDDHMKLLHQSYPQYGWHQNKGYGTKVHRDAILQHGLCEFHRKSFQINAASPSLF
ncbi:MAG: ribonuclease HII [Flavipsychrobacter sp.]|jgi:ribonuclease HII|nr:ribonuclease HII [Flavipsychrobacter sp.]